MHIQRYEDLKIWKMGIELAKDVYALTNQGAFLKDFGLRDQIRRAIVSVSSNIVEGFERDTQKEFIRYLTIAKSSACEARSQLRIAREINYIQINEEAMLSKKIEHCTRSICQLIHYLKKHNKPTI